MRRSPPGDVPFSSPQEDGEEEKVPRILVVDDDVDFQIIMRRMLEVEGYEVSIAENGDQALRSRDGARRQT